MDSFKDFEALAGSSGGNKRKRWADQVCDNGGEKRKYLKIFETPPVQLLNAFGESSYTRMSDDKVWSLLSKPQKTGAQYISELCFSEVDRRGVGLNRVFAALIQYLEYQTDKEVRTQNEFLLKD